MLIVQHTTRLSYSDRISETVMEVRKAPRDDPYQVLRGHRTDIGPPTTLVAYTDWLGNRVHQFSILPYHDQVIIMSQSAVDIDPEPANLSGEGAAGVSEHPLEVFDFVRPSTLVGEDPRLVELTAKLGVDASMGADQRADRVATALRDHIGYKKGVTTSAATLACVLDEGAGVCQDLAHVAVGLFRSWGIPARYVSGYLFLSDGPQELETHAWCDIHQPGIGWTALDPTHCCRRTPGHIVVAVGRDYADVPPNRGVFRGDAKESISVEVSIYETVEMPDTLRAPGIVTLDAPTFGEAAQTHEESLDYQQEQQQQ